jgi:cytochrome P450
MTPIQKRVDYPETGILLLFACRYAVPDGTPVTQCPHLAGVAASSDAAGDRAGWLDSGQSPAIVEPYFDTQMDGWVLSRYADVLAAFRSPDLWPTGPTSKRKQSAVDLAARLKMRAETTQALSRASLRSWRNQMLNDARARTAAFDFNRPMDLIQDYALPVCLALAIQVTHPTCDDPDRLFALAVRIAAAAEEPFDEQLKAQSKVASAELQEFFPSGPESLRESGFVGLSRTLVHLMGNMWFALLRHPEEWKRLHAQPASTQPTLVARSMEELLRFAGLTRLLFRRAVADTTVNGLHIQQGDRVILRILAANRDQERFPDPDVLSVNRPRLVHLSLGAGRHHCVGAPLIRAAAVAATLPLIERFPRLRLLEPVPWRGGSGYSAPASLFVMDEPARSASVQAV